MKYEEEETKAKVNESEAYYKLLDLVNIQKDKGLHKLAQDFEKEMENDGKIKQRDDRSGSFCKSIQLVERMLNKFEKDDEKTKPEFSNDWESLTQWNGGTSDKYKNPRQDIVPGGLKPKYSYSELLQRTTSKFDAAKFYDLNQYLAELVLLAQIVDDEFQESIQNIFNIDKSTKMGHIGNNKEDEKEINDESNGIEYIRGPIKLMKRAKSKAENDYCDRNDYLWPSSACILDLNRCCLVFKNIKTLLSAIKLFENKIKYYQSGNIIDIVRDKNGFKKFVEKGPRYADIKLNVLIRGEAHNIIGKIQFILETMIELKNSSHNLYAIQRQEEFIFGAVKHILPKLLDLDKQTNISVLHNDIKGLCDVMVFGNKTKEFVYRIDKEKNQSVLQLACAHGNTKVFKFIQSLMTEQELADRVFLSTAQYNETPLENAIQWQWHELAEYILSFDCVQNKLREKDTEHYDNMIWRLLFYICNYGNHKSTLYFTFLNSLGITNHDICTYFKYRHPETTQKFLAPTAWKYEAQTLTIRLFGNIAQLQRLVSIFGEKVIGENTFSANCYNVSCIDKILRNNNHDTLQYLLSLNHVKEKCLKDKDVRWKMLFWILKEGKKETFDYVVNDCKFTKEKIIDILSYNFPQPTENEKEYLKNNAWNYHTAILVHQIMRNKNFIDLFESLISLVGEEVVCKNMFTPNVYNNNGINMAIRNGNIESLKYVLSIPMIRETCLKDKNIRWRIIFWVFREGDVSLLQYILRKLEFTKEAIIGIFSEYYPQPTDQEKQYLIQGHWSYWEYMVVHQIFDNKEYVKICEVLLSIVDQSDISRGILTFNATNHNVITLSIWYNKLEKLKYIFDTFVDVKEECIKDMNTRWIIVFFMYKQYEQCRDVTNYLMKTFNFTKDALSEIVSYKYSKPDDVSYVALNGVKQLISRYVYVDKNDIYIEIHSGIIGIGQYLKKLYKNYWISSIMSYSKFIHGYIISFCRCVNFFCDIAVLIYIINNNKINLSSISFPYQIHFVTIKVYYCYKQESKAIMYNEPFDTSLAPLVTLNAVRLKL